MPLAVIGAPAATAEAVLATKKTRIYIQGNIHAGEVEGKEALLWLLRSIAKGERAEWFNVGRPAHQPDLQRRRERARQRGEPREPERPRRRHGPAHQRAEPRPEPGLHEDGNRRGPLAGHAAHRVRPAHGHRSPHDRRERRQRLLPHLRDLAQSERLEGDGRPAAQRPAPAGHQGGQGEARLGLLLLRRHDARRQRARLGVGRGTGQAALHLDVLRRAEQARHPRGDVLGTHRSRTGSRRPTGSSRRSSTSP